MKNKKKRATETMLNPSHHSDAPVNSVNSEMAIEETNNQLNHPIEVKEEPGFKAEPQLIVEIVDIPAPINRHLVDQPNDGYDFESLDFDDVKIVAKEEIDEKKKDGLKANADSGDDATGNQHDPQQQTQRDEDDSLGPESSHSAKNTKACSKVGNPKNASKKYHCGICVYSTDLKGNLSQHLLKHTGMKPHGCNFCAKRFTKKQYLRTHMKVHVEEFLFHCPSCLEGFSDKDEKKAHETICKIRRYECHLCKESFGSMKANMMRHMRVHCGNRPFGCKECFKMFTGKGSLNRHMKLHAGPRLFRCSKCNTRFSQQEERNAHEKKCNRPVFKCDVCGKSLGYQSKLIIHMSTHTGQKPFECKKCPKKFTTKQNLMLHMKHHTKELSSKCLICHKGFLKDEKRKAHQRNCNGRYYECYLCMKFFESKIDQLKGHMHTHSGEKPFQCQLCCEMFTRKVNLNSHMKNIHQK